MATIVIFIAAIITSGVGYAVARSAGAGETSALVVAQVVMGAAVLVFGLLYRQTLPRHERRAMVLTKVGIGSAIGIGLAVAVAARVGMGIINAIALQLDPSLCKTFNDVALDQKDTPLLWHKILIAVSLVLLAPLGEELVFRGILLRGLVRAMSFPLAALVAGVLFGLAHQNYWIAWPLILGICLFGVVASVIYRRYGYGTSVATHAFFNAVVAVFLFVGIDTGTTDCPSG